jgi:5-methylcytosine-specific restriction endonuclease McrA
MSERAKIKELPPSMAERAVTARRLAHADPRAVEIDDEMLPWVFDPEQGVWLSFDGNYSASSPGEKRLKAEAQRRKQEEWAARSDEIARERFEVQMVWSMTREAVLKRDQYSCRMCGSVKESALHIHHILKRVEGGTDHMDNLITVCNRCHKAADTKFYDPDWTQRPADVCA